MRAHFSEQRLLIETKVNLTPIKSSEQFLTKKIVILKVVSISAGVLNYVY